ncbi:MAG TPA: histidine kinase [Anaerolineae bacterium]|nr:histidine kinase [Anaerolineae bacterium]
MNAVFAWLRRLWPRGALLGIVALVVPILSGAILAHQVRTPFIGLYVDDPVIVDVLMGGSAQRAGLRSGDVIRTVDGVPHAEWSPQYVGQVCYFEVLRAGQSLMVEVSVFSMLRANRLSTDSALLAAGLFWGVGLLLLWRTRDAWPVQLLFLLYQAMAVMLLPGLAYPRFWLPPRWMLVVEYIGLHLTAPLLLHYTLTYPVELGAPRLRRWGLGLLYGLAGLSMADAARRAVPWTGWAMGVALAETVAAIGVIAWVYFRRATPDMRRRLRLVVAGFIVGLTPPLVGYMLPTVLMGYSPDVPRWAISLCLTLIPLTALYATVRHNLFGIDRLLNRALVYGSLSAGTLALYTGLLLALDYFAPGNAMGHALVIGGLTLPLGLVFDGVRTRVQRGVDVLFYGGWYDYPGVVERVSVALSRSLEWETLADILTVQTPALMQLRSGELQVDEQATPPLDPALQPQLRFPLYFEGQMHGVWVIGPRRDGQNFSTTDRRILQTLVHQAEIAVGNMLLVSALRRQLEEILGSRELLTRIGHEMLRTREAERARLSRELHDSPIQTLIGLNMQLGMLPASTAAPFQEIRAEIKGLIAELRAVCADLHPQMLDTVGLGAALRVLAEEWAAQHAIVVDIATPPDAVLRTLPGEVAINLYRIAQEALTNIARHAAAQRVVLNLQWDAGCLRLRVQDDGPGFAPATLPQLAADGHLGLAGMQERAALIGAQWMLDSAPGRGTTIAVVWQSPPNSPKPQV